MRSEYCCSMCNICDVELLCLSSPSSEVVRIQRALSEDMLRHANLKAMRLSLLTTPLPMLRS